MTRRVVVDVRLVWDLDPIGPADEWQAFAHRAAVGEDLERSELLDRWMDDGAVVSIGYILEEDQEEEEVVDHGDIEGQGT